MGYLEAKVNIRSLESMLGKSVRNHGMGAGAELEGMMV